MKTSCRASGCDRETRARGFCHMHYQRWLKYGDPAANFTPVATPPADRFWALVDRKGPEECWLFRGSQAHGGYGKFGVKEGTEWKRRRAHRFAYELLVGPIPKGLVLDHLCRQPLCVNPAHLEPVTNAENIRRGFALRTHCPHGHLYDEENTYITRRGHRLCRACGRNRPRRVHKTLDELKELP